MNAIIAVLEKFYFLGPQVGSKMIKELNCGLSYNLNYYQNAFGDFLAVQTLRKN